MLDIYFDGAFLKGKRFGISVDSANILRDITALGYNLEILENDFTTSRGKAFYYIKYLLTKSLRRFTQDLESEKRKIKFFNTILIESQFSVFPILEAKYTILRVHDLFPLTNPQWFNLRSIVQFRLSTKRYSPETIFLCNSRFTKSELERLYPIWGSNAIIYPCDRPSNESKPCENCQGCARISDFKKEEFFLAIGTIEPRKNYNNLLLNWQIFFQDNHAHKLVIIGREGWKAKQVLRKLRGKFALANNIFYLDYVCDSSKEKFLSMALAYISASHSEGFNITLLEAIFMKKKICLSHIPAHCELLLDSEAYWFDNNNPVTMLDAIRECAGEKLSDKISDETKERFVHLQQTQKQELSNVLNRLVTSLDSY